MHDDDILSRSWFVISTSPGREHDAGVVLRQADAVVFMPLEIKRHRPNHHSKRRWTYWMPLLGRYVVAGFRQETPPWFDLLEHSSISGVVDYRPVRRSSMLDLILRYGSTALEPPERRRARTSIEEITAGCEALVLSGPYFGRTVSVKDLVPTRHGKGRAKVLIPMLNSEHVVELPLDELEMEIAA